MVVTDPQAPQYWGDLTGERLDPHEVAKEPKLEIDNLNHVGVKMSLQEERAGHPHVLGAWWVVVKKAGVTHRSRLVVREITTYNAPELFALRRTLISTFCTWA